MTTATMAAPQPWYRSLNATQWKTVFASNLGWTFDGYETFSLILVVGVALRICSMPSQFAQIPAFAGTVIGITLLGWGIGGVIGGVLADYLGRRRTMILAILGLFDHHRPVGLRLGLGVVRLCASWSASPSARNGRPAPRSPPKCGPTTRAAAAPD